MLAWVEAGQPVELFWELTLREIQTVIEGAANAAFKERESIYYGAYFSGVFSQSYAKGKFPKFEKYAPKRKKAGGKKRDWLELKTLVQTWIASAGVSDNKKDGST